MKQLTDRMNSSSKSKKNKGAINLAALQNNINISGNTITDEETEQAVSEIQETTENMVESKEILVENVVEKETLAENISETKEELVEKPQEIEDKVETLAEITEVTPIEQPIIPVKTTVEPANVTSGLDYANIQTVQSKKIKYGKKETKDVTVSFKVEKSIVQSLDSICEQNGYTKANVLRDLVIMFINEELAEMEKNK